MHPFKTPYPTFKFVELAFISVIIGCCVSFTLSVFQPFGTAHFQHPYKIWLLLGYGGAITFVLLILSYFIFIIFKLYFHDKWTVGHQILVSFLFSFVSILVSFAYLNLIVLNGSISIKSFLNFLPIGLAVGVLPAFFTGYYWQQKWKGIIDSELIIPKKLPQKNKKIKPSNTSKKLEFGLITLIGKNKADKITVQKSEILYLEAMDNYVILHLFLKNKIQKHLLRIPLVQLFSQIDSSQFIRVHRSYIVNKNLIKSIIGNKNKASLLLSIENISVSISRSHFESVKKLV